MKKIDVGQTVSILANMGVIAGIVFLGYELRQNNEFLAAEARANRLDIRREALFRELNNRDLRQARIKQENGQALTADEQRLIFRDNEAALVDWQYVYLEARFGFLEDRAVPVAGWRNTFHERNIGMPELWADTKQTFDPDFVRWMDENIVNLE